MRDQFLFLKKTVLLRGLITAGLLLVFTSLACAAPSNNTVEVYKTTTEGILVTGLYQGNTGTPTNVSPYSQVRINHVGNNGTTIMVQIIMTNSASENLGLLDEFTLGGANPFNMTRVYDVPGKYVKIYYQSSDPFGVNTIIYGR